MVVTLLSTNPTRRLPWLQRAQLVPHPQRLRGAEVPILPPAAPPWTPPVLLDTTDLPPLHLCRLLNTLVSPMGAPLRPTLALVAADDRVALHLVHLCPAVLLLCTEHCDPTLLQLWLHLLRGFAPGQVTPRGPCLLDPALARSTLPLPPLLLRLLPVLAESSTWQDAAWSAGFSSRHLRRFTNSLRVILDLPPYRMHPYGFTQQVLAALADAPVAGEAERAVG